MKIKVCGLKYADNIAAVAALGPDYEGFICYDKSPRFIGDVDVASLKGLPADIVKTGVFVNASEVKIKALIARYAFGAVQLHGDESPEFCKQCNGEVQVIKAFGVDDKFDFNQLKPYVGHVDYFMFDTKTATHGGSGKTFDWSILNKYELDIPFFLSGGLSPDNIEEVKQIDHPMLYAVDLNSRFEIEPGLKDVQKLKKAFNTIKDSYSNEVRS